MHRGFAPFCQYLRATASVERRVEMRYGSTVTPEQAIRKARAGELLPVYLVLGDERLLVEQVVGSLREHVLEGSPAAFNEDKLIAGETDVDRVIAAARMVPMMAKRRLVVVRSVERWEARASSNEEGAEAAATSGKGSGSPLDRLAEYAADPSPMASLILIATKLDSRRKLVTLAKKGDFLVSCEPLARGALPGWIAREAKARGHAIAPDVASLLAQISGPELAYVADALERTMLYVGEGAPITEEAIDACVVRTRMAPVWDMIDALGRRDLGKALAALSEVIDERGALPLLSLVTGSVRQLLKFESAARGGASIEEAARMAGAPPFKGRDLAAQTRAIPRYELERWLTVLAATDLSLKGSRRTNLAVLETMVMDLCARR